MTGPFDPYAYSEGPRAQCAWDLSRDWPQFNGPGECEVAIVGAGVTGLSAALTLAEAGLRVTVLDAQAPGWGASGRNGGFCCVGGSAIGDRALSRRFGTDATRAYRLTEIAAVAHVDALIRRLGLDVARHSAGEVQLAHSPRAMAGFQAAVAGYQDLGVGARVLSKQDLDEAGMSVQGIHGGLHLDVGFGLDPGAYVRGLAQAARAAGAEIFALSPVNTLDKLGASHRLTTPRGQLTAARVILATNGYSPNRLGPLKHPVLPMQSNVLVTRPITPDERAAQGWTSDLMAYDTRALLHYFRLMPDGRFLFGMRGGLRGDARDTARVTRRMRAQFHALFPAWRDIDVDHIWSGLVAVSADLTPHVAPVAGDKSVLAAMAYHGNGVAMGSFAGHAAGQLLLGQDIRPRVMAAPLKPFPLGRFRRVFLRASHAAAVLHDRL